MLSSMTRSANGAASAQALGCIAPVSSRSCTGFPVARQCGLPACQGFRGKAHSRSCGSPSPSSACSDRSVCTQSPRSPTSVASQSPPSIAARTSCSSPANKPFAAGVDTPCTGSPTPRNKVTWGPMIRAELHARCVRKHSDAILGPYSGRRCVRLSLMFSWRLWTKPGRSLEGNDNPSQHPGCIH